LFPVTLSGVNGRSGTLSTKQILQMALERKIKKRKKNKENFFSVIYNLDKFDR